MLLERGQRPDNIYLIHRQVYVLIAVAIVVKFVFYNIVVKECFIFYFFVFCLSRQFRFFHKIKLCIISHLGAILFIFSNDRFSDIRPASSSLLSFDCLMCSYSTYKKRKHSLRVFYIYTTEKSNKEENHIKLAYFQYIFSSFMADFILIAYMKGFTSVENLILMLIDKAAQSKPNIVFCIGNIFHCFWSIKPTRESDVMCVWELYLVEIDVLNIQQSFNNICYEKPASMV